MNPDEAAAGGEVAPTFRLGWEGYRSVPLLRITLRNKHPNCNKCGHGRSMHAAHPRVPAARRLITNVAIRHSMRTTTSSCFHSKSRTDARYEQRAAAIGVKGALFVLAQNNQTARELEALLSTMLRVQKLTKSKRSQGSNKCLEAVINGPGRQDIATLSPSRMSQTPKF